MTVYEHAMIGVDGALAVGLDRRYGWPIVAFAGCAAAFPDWDGLTLLLGADLYALGHRIWGHNLLVAGLLGAVTAWLFWRFDLLSRAQKGMAAYWAAFQFDSPVSSRATSPLTESLVWIAVGIIAAYSHLLADCLFSTGTGLPAWKLPLLWPFTKTLFALPMVPWGDVGTTMVLIAGMFAMVRWPSRRRAIAIATVGLVITYIVVRGTCFRSTLPPSRHPSERTAMSLNAAPVLVLDAMGVIYRVGDDVGQLLVPFIRREGGVHDIRRIEGHYLPASLGAISSGEFAFARGFAEVAPLVEALTGAM
jgi:membrane-bound metal-dependent hydrolase YbcI (DUF457 family)